ncbi:MAG: DUF4919 domain-containing protein [Proteobacteria bacterium]|nr:MAG: DUF4919 domain-containing protein [Pseudomonadota bacterium]
MRRLGLIMILLIGNSICFADAPLKLPSGAEFTKIRMAFAAKPDFSPMWKVDDERDVLLEAYKAKDYKKVSELSKPWLEKVPVDADAHLIRAQALKKLGDLAGFSYHFHCFYGLIHSIASSGDGKSPETAFKVISVAEEYYLLDEIGARLIEQNLQHPHDVMRVRLRDGTETTLYFDVSISFEATARELQPKK